QLGHGQLREHLVLLHPAADVDLPVVRRAVLLVRVVRDHPDVPGELGEQGGLLERLDRPGLLHDPLDRSHPRLYDSDLRGSRSRPAGRGRGLAVTPDDWGEPEDGHQLAANGYDASETSRAWACGSAFGTNCRLAGSNGSIDADARPAPPITRANTAGRAKRVVAVAAASPPITARPSGAVWSLPSPDPMAIGTIPAIIAQLVIRIGRTR